MSITTRCHLPGTLTVRLRMRDSPNGALYGLEHTLEANDPRLREDPLEYIKQVVDEMDKKLKDRYIAERKEHNK